jgi:ADP-ribosylglycohydrolase
MFLNTSADPSSCSPPEGTWKWTDDTHMALSIVEVLLAEGKIIQDELARLFAERFVHEPWRGYASGAKQLLTRYAEGVDWRTEAPRLFGSGSFGNGGAMRAAPIGAYFSGDPQRAAHEGVLSAQVTHSHAEGQAGAAAVAAAAAIIDSGDSSTGTDFLKAVIPFVPVTRTREIIEDAVSIDGNNHQEAVRRLGTGQLVAAFDTVPFCLWVVAHNSREFDEALWVTVRGQGDMDTTCAIVGGIIAMKTPIPREWLRHREPLPEGFSV